MTAKHLAANVPPIPLAVLSIQPVLPTCMDFQSTIYHHIKIFAILATLAIFISSFIQWIFGQCLLVCACVPLNILSDFIYYDMYITYLYDSFTAYV